MAYCNNYNETNNSSTNKHKSYPIPKLNEEDDDNDDDKNKEIPKPKTKPKRTKVYRRKSLNDSSGLTVPSPKISNRKSPSLYNVSNSCKIRPSESIIDITESEDHVGAMSSILKNTHVKRGNGIITAEIKRSVSKGLLSDITSCVKAKHRGKTRLESDEIFEKDAAEVIIERLLVNKLKSLHEIGYHPSICKRFSEVLCREILTKVSELHYSKYRQVIIAHMGKVSRSQEEFHFKSRCLWDLQYDKSVSVHKNHENLFGIVELFMAV